MLFLHDVLLFCESSYSRINLEIAFLLIRIHHGNYANHGRNQIFSEERKRRFDTKFRFLFDESAWFETLTIFFIPNCFPQGPCVIFVFLGASATSDLKRNVTLEQPHFALPRLTLV